MQTFAVFSGETENRINASEQRKSDQESDEGDGGHLGARNTWPADSKELGSNDCISVRQIQKVTLVLFVLHLCETESRKAQPLCTHTGAAASHHSGLPGCRIHCKGVTPDQDYR